MQRALVRTWYFFSAVLASLIAFTTVAHAQNLVDPADGSADVARALYGALTGGHYAYAGALVIVGAIALLRKLGGARFPALHTDAGAAMLALGGAFGTAMAASLAGGGAFSWPMLAAAGATAFAAMGGYAAVKKIAIEPYLVPWSQKAPAWLRPVLTLVVFWFEHKSDPQDAAKFAAPQPAPQPAQSSAPAQPAH